ncbi:uncharacterized protein LOC128406638 [Podarcis raffonei]|uniref:uncharacterized protein LOC128406638 n=1 Tax=Podarcis raffonei TaxID=65483 RepID=UPI0023298190|nr:uncharacterized protein LOC128406638 [Podarcis raffonei]
MALALWAAFLLFIGHSFQLGILLPPQNVTLISENFYTFLTWHQSPNSTNSTQYEVEKSNGNRSYPDWIKEPSCRRRNLRGNRSCQLHLSDVFSFYQARVRAQDGGRWSEWTYSDWLQPYKDTVVGPLILSLAAADHSITVSISMPQILLKENDSLDFTSLLKIRIILSSEGGDFQNVMLCEDELNSCWMDSKQRRINVTKHTFKNVKPNTNYCVKAEVANQPTREAVQCIKTPPSSTGDYWTLSVIVLASVFGLILLSGVGKTFLKQYMQLSTSEMDLPKSLVFLNRNSSALIPALHLEADSVVFISTTVQLPLEDGLPTEQENPQFQQIPGSLGAQGSSDYCPNGFDKGNEDPSCLSVAVVDSLSSGGLVREDYSADEDYRSAVELLESSEHPSPSPGGFRFGGLEKVSWECRTSYKSGQVRWLPSSGADIPLSSLKLQAHLDTQGLVYSPGPFDLVKGCNTYPEAPAKQVAELQVYQDQSSFLEDAELRSTSSLEAKDTMAMSFPGYELHPPILFCGP